MTLGRVLNLAFASFLVHFLPPRFRLPFFAPLSVTTTVAVVDALPELTWVAIGLGSSAFVISRSLSGAALHRSVPSGSLWPWAARIGTG